VSGPTVVGRRLFVQANSGTVYALEAATGDVLWRRDVYRPSSTSTPAVASGDVYVAADTRVVSLRAPDGHLRWKAELPDQAARSPTVVDGVVYEAVLEAGVYALSARTGEVLWHQPTGLGMENTPTVDDHSVYVGDVDGNLYSFDRTTGVPRWTSALGWRFVLNDPVEANGVIYAATIGVFALDARTGDKLWSAPTAIVNTDRPVVNGTLYVGDFDGAITAYGLPGS
jgi:outer membrane protein assembly factor BamB